MTRVEIAYAIGEQIFAGDSLTVVLADIETIDELPDLFKLIIQRWKNNGRVSGYKAR